MQHTLIGKGILITQADEFMGPALCEVFAQQGAEVVASTAELAPPGAAAQGVAPAMRVWTTLETCQDTAIPWQPCTPAHHRPFLP